MEADKTFSISAKTCTLKYNSQEGKGTVFGSGTKYIIPIYQRPYSWKDEQIRKFLSDIFSSYWGNERNIAEEPMFIGTMQLSAKNGQNEQNIIDGQQRLTTFLILFKVLINRFPESEELKNIKLDWLKSRVNNGSQQIFLDEILDGGLEPNDETLNPYLKNALIINKIIEEEIKNDEGKETEFDIDKFSKHLLSNVYFVVIETYAGLSKTLQIFNAINTTGLDLNGGDIFKLRMFEYLKDKKNRDENAFNEISKLYEKIDENNKKAKYNVTNINEILGIYQYILIAKYNLPVTLYGDGTDTFYERLFDTIFNNKQWEHFKNNVKNLELSFEEIEKIIDLRFEYENNWYKSAEDACAYKLIQWSRYSKFWILAIIFLFRFKTDEDYQEKMFLFKKELNKLYIICSVIYQRSIGEITTFSYSLVPLILNETADDVIKKVKEKVLGTTYYRGDNKAAFEKDINGNIVYNHKVKHILCRLSGMLEENYQTTDKEKIEEIKRNLFDTAIDIEHIQSYNDSDGEKREDIIKEWGDEINSIGNLMVLEEPINRSISNNPYAIKIESYPSSVFTIVKNQVGNFSNWDLEKCRARKQKETEKILRYIFN